MNCIQSLCSRGFSCNCSSRGVFSFACFSSYALKASVRRKVRRKIARVISRIFIVGMGRVPLQADDADDHQEGDYIESSHVSLHLT